MRNNYKRLASIACIGSLFAATSVSLRYLEILNLMRFPRPTSVLSRISPSIQSCTIKKESLFSLLETKNRPGLIVVLDGYPKNTLYESLYGEKSTLHAYLNSIAERAINSTTLLNQTPYSLAYILGNYTHENSTCLYPFANLPIKVTQLLATPNYSNKLSLCREYFTSRPFFKTKLAALLSLGSFPKITKRSTECSLASMAVASEIVNHKIHRGSISSQSPTSESLPRLDVIHDTFYHDRDIHDYPPEKTDRLYRKSLKAFFSNHSFVHQYSLIIVMSDHGPRHSINNSSKHFLTDNPSPVRLGSASDDMEYSFFLYCIQGCLPVSDNQSIPFLDRIKKQPLRRFTINKLHRVVPVKTE